MVSALRFEWDDAKNAENRRKHGIAFEQAAEILFGPVLTRIDDHPHAEAREISFGFLGTGMVVVVAHTDREGGIRMISARRATARERRLFHAYLEESFS